MLHIKKHKNLVSHPFVVLLGMQRCPSERVGSVLNPTIGFEGFRILEAPIRKVPSPPAKTYTQYGL